MRSWSAPAGTSTPGQDLGHRHPCGGRRLPRQGRARPREHGPLPVADAGRPRQRRRVVRRDPRHAGLPTHPLEAPPDLRRLQGSRPDAVPRVGGSIPAWCDVIAAEKRLASYPDLHEVLIDGIGLEPALRRVDLAHRPTANWPPTVAAGHRPLRPAAASRPQRRHDVGKPVRADRPRIEIALSRVAARVDELVALSRFLDALRDRRDPEGLRHGDDGRDQSGVGAVRLAHVAHEGLIDLQDSCREALQIRERGVLRAEVVDGDPHAKPADPGGPPRRRPDRP